MTLYLLDTNTVSDVIKHRPSVLERLTVIPAAVLRISAVTEGELLFGLALRPEASRIAIAAYEMLRRIEVIAWGREAAQTYGLLRANLQRAGKKLEPLDMLIAAQAVSVGATLVTADKAFLSVADLVVENWRDA